jgi:hypothetical protein
VSAFAEHETARKQIQKKNLLSAGFKLAPWFASNKRDIGKLN